MGTSSVASLSESSAGVLKVVLGQEQASSWKISEQMIITLWLVGL